MEHERFQDWLASIDRLSPAQMLQAQAALIGETGPVESSESRQLREEKLAEALARSSVESYRSDIENYRGLFQNFKRQALENMTSNEELFSTMFRFYQDTARLMAIRHSKFLPDSISGLIESTDDALGEIVHLQESGVSQAPQELANRAYRGMKSIIEGLAEQ